MKRIVNKTQRPLKIKLSQGRVLRLGPAKEGHIATPDAERESVRRSVEAGELEIFDDLTRSGARAGAGSGSRSNPQAAHRQFSGAKRGDR
jgi:hypothetical protein